jgi:two-component system sensor histidine kinase TctE
MNSYSLRRRLLLWLLLATVVIGLLALADTWREALRTAQSVSDRVLAGSALAIAERVTVDEAGGLEVDIPYSSLEMLVSTAQDQVFYRVDGPVGTFLTGYADLANVQTGPEGIGFGDGTYGNVRIRAATLLRSVSTGSESIPFMVTVAESTRARDDLARAILVRSALRLLVLIAGVVVIVWLTVTLALRPLNRLGEAIAQRSSDDLRPVTVAAPQEVRQLIDAINSFMQRLDTVLAALRHFTGNASHQLRTPLAVVRTQLALATRSTDPVLAEEAALKADTALIRAERVLAQLLVLARVDAAAGARSLVTTDIAQTARMLSAEMVPDALRRGIDLGYEGADSALVRAEPVLLAELLQNLLDNAIAYAGQGAFVTVRVQEHPDGTRLEVEDNGTGIPPDKIAYIAGLGQGTRPDVRRTISDTSTGYGFGLAIVAEIGALFGATMEVGTGKDEAGFKVCLTFPKDDPGAGASGPDMPQGPHG